LTHRNISLPLQAGCKKITPMDAKSIGGGVANDRRLATICPSKQKPICLYEK